MAVRFDATGERITVSTGIPATNGPWTWMGWIYISTAKALGWVWGPTTTAQTVLYDGLLADYNATNTRLMIAVDNNTYFEVRGSTNLSASTWYHVALVRTSSTAIVAYLNGILEVTGPTEPAGTKNLHELGCHNSFTADYFNGRIADSKLFAAALTATEILQEMQRGYPVFYTPTCFQPLFDAADLADYSGNGQTVAPTGTLTTEAGPPIVWGGAIIVPSFAAAGGTQYTQAVTGGMSAAGVLARDGRKVLSGAI